SGLKRPRIWKAPDPKGKGKLQLVHQKETRSSKKSDGRLRPQPKKSPPHSPEGGFEGDSLGEKKRL
ncbi:hypothetical protein QQ054_18940, partial [Oscillatoria amoena NRMC-F 0135]|nr:hypothetical protein [Oscillatoria amoena NRMC-F 0135]